VAEELEKALKFYSGNNAPVVVIKVVMTRSQGLIKRFFNRAAESLLILVCDVIPKSLWMFFGVNPGYDNSLPTISEMARS